MEGAGGVDGGELGLVVVPVRGAESWAWARGLQRSVYLGDIYQYLVKFTGPGDRLDMGGTERWPTMTPDLGFVYLIINQVSYQRTTSSLKSLFGRYFWASGLEQT